MHRLTLGILTPGGNPSSGRVESRSGMKSFHLAEEQLGQVGYFDGTGAIRRILARASAGGEGGEQTKLKKITREDDLNAAERSVVSSQQFSENVKSERVQSVRGKSENGREQRDEDKLGEEFMSDHGNLVNDENFGFEPFRRSHRCFGVQFVDMLVRQPESSPGMRRDALHLKRGDSTRCGNPVRSRFILQHGANLTEQETLSDPRTPSEEDVLSCLDLFENLSLFLGTAWIDDEAWNEDFFQ